MILVDLQKFYFKKGEESLYILWYNHKSEIMQNKRICLRSFRSEITKKQVTKRTFMNI